jgi:hypothetical protein
MIEHKEILRTNLFTYPLLDKMYVDLHWLYQLCLYSIFSLKSYSGLIIFNSIIILLSIIILYCRVKEVSISRIYLFPLFVILFCIKPKLQSQATCMFSWIFLSLQLLLIKNVLKGNKLSFYLIFFVQVIWINFHSLAISWAYHIFNIFCWRLFQKQKKLIYKLD